MSFRTFLQLANAFQQYGTVSVVALYDSRNLFNFYLLGLPVSIYEFILQSAVKAYRPTVYRPTHDKTIEKIGGLCIWDTTAFLFYSLARTLALDPTFISSIFFIFTARRYASAVLAVIVCLSVRLSVTSRSCTKTAKPSITLRTAYDSPGTLVFRGRKFWRNSNDTTPNGGTNYRWGRFLAALCDQYLNISQKRCKTGTQLLWKANRNLYALYRMVLFSMTLDDP